MSDCGRERGGVQQDGADATQTTAVALDRNAWRRSQSNAMQPRETTVLGYTFNQQFFVGWGTLALLVAGVAQGKGHSGLLWFILSLLFGPLALLILLFLARQR